MEFPILRDAKCETVILVFRYARCIKMNSSVSKLAITLSLVACFSCASKPAFWTREQAEKKLGHSVVCRKSTERDRVMKCPEDGGDCLPVYEGDGGRVIGLDPGGENDTVGIKIQWLDEGQPTGYYSFAYSDAPQLEIK
jgi:hypothetical protein